MPILKKNALKDVEDKSQNNCIHMDFTDNAGIDNGIQLIGVQKKDSSGQNYPNQQTTIKFNKEETKVVSFAESDCVIPDDTISTNSKNSKESKKVVKKSWVYAYNFGCKQGKQTKNSEAGKAGAEYSEGDSDKDRKQSYDFIKAKFHSNESPVQLSKYTSNSSPGIQKSYNIGKNTKFNISVRYPMAGLISRGNKGKKLLDDIPTKAPTGKNILKGKNDSNIPPCPKVGGRCPSFVNPVLGRERELLKNVSPFRKMTDQFSKPLGGAPKQPLPPLPPDIDQLNGDEESDESFRTFVLETSVYDDFDSSSAIANKLLIRRADVGKMVVSKSPGGDNAPKIVQSQIRRKNKHDYKKLSFKPAFQNKLKNNFNNDVDKCFSLVDDDEDKIYEQLMVPKPDYEPGYSEEAWNHQLRLLPKRDGSTKVGDHHEYDSSFSPNSKENLTECYNNSKVPNLKKNNIGFISHIRKPWKKVPSHSCDERNLKRHFLKKEQLSSKKICLKRQENSVLRITEMELPRKGVSLEHNSSMAPDVPPRTTSKPDYRSLTSFDPFREDTPSLSTIDSPSKSKSNEFSCSCPPKPCKGILKKYNPPCNVSDQRCNNEPPSSFHSFSRSRIYDSPVGSTTESDSGLDCEFEYREGEPKDDANTCNHSLATKSNENIKDLVVDSAEQVLRGWKQKYDFLLGLVKEPGRLLPETLTEEVRLLETKRQGFFIERSLVRANIDSWENMGGAKGRRANDRPEGIRALYEQVANLDCMLTSLETQIEVLSSVQDSLPKEFHVDTFHDSGTSGHEPDSLEAIEHMIGEAKINGPRGAADSDNRGAKGPGNGPGPGGGNAAEATILLHLERCAHRQTRRCLQETKQKFEALQQEIAEKKIGNCLIRSAGSDIEELHLQHEMNLNSLESLSSIASADRVVEELKLREMTISQLRMRVLQLEKARLDKVPMDAAKEISRLKDLIIQLEKARDELTLQNFTLKSRLADVTSNIHDPTATYQINKDFSLNIKEKENINPGDNKDVEVQKLLRKSTYKVNAESQKLLQLYSEFGATEQEYKKRIDGLETELLNQQNAATQKFDRHIRNLENQLQETQKKVEVTEQYLMGKEEECNMIKLDFDTLNEENKRLKEQLNETYRKQQEISSLQARCHQLGKELSKLEDENRLLVEDFNRERVLRKKYYNQIEEMKGKIRVFCRLRPFTDQERRSGGEEVTRVEDEFSLALDTSRGSKTFLFDRVFTQREGQEQVFEDTHALIQSALDGYNVTIMAYGQTGSGKTYTMLGTEASPGIAPRAFKRIFRMAEEGKSRHDISVSAYMMELYNDRLIDLLKCNGYTEPSEKLDIKRDKKGTVYVSGAVVRNVSSSNELMKVFEEGLSNRHTACTKMNLSSSRSHLLITVMLTVTSKQTGSVFKGKLTLVDLAGSERVQKSGASADQLKEANSINKSLSALGDVVAALSSESSFVPYRNSKLTMLLQDSIGGNAKSLVFVNISPAAYNCDETLVSLMYASRIKQITNNACKNADIREISRLKMIISKLKKGEEIAEDDL